MMAIDQDAEVKNLLSDMTGICQLVKLRAPRIILGKVFEPFLERWDALSPTQRSTFWNMVSDQERKDLNEARQAYVWVSKKPDRHLPVGPLIIWVLLMFVVAKSKLPEEEAKLQEPRWAAFFACFLPKAVRDPLRGDLEEAYPEIYAKFGRRRARFWYCWSVFASLWPLAWREAERIAKLVSKFRFGR